MDRRNLLQALSIAPLALGPYRTSSPVPEPSPPHHPGPKVLIPDSPEAMARALSFNLERHAAQDRLKWDEKELELQHRVCLVMCQNLRKWEFSDPYAMSRLPGDEYVPWPRGFEDVLFGVMPTPVSYYEDMPGRHRELTAQARKVKVRWAPELVEDILCPPIDPEEELVKAWGSETALEVQMEIRADFRDQRKVRLYAFYLPPFVPPVDPELYKDFSVHRRPRIKYAKLMV